MFKDIFSEKVHTIMILTFWTERPKQKVQTQIRLLLEEQFDQDYTICRSICANGQISVHGWPG